MTRIAIVAALPGELKPLVKPGWTKVATPSPTIYKWTNTVAGVNWIAVCAGMGADAARRAFAEAEKDGPLDGVVSVGWAGALRDTGYAGEFLVPSLVVDAQTGERYALTNSARDCVLVTVTQVADEREKTRLRETYGGSLVDMESATVVRLAQMRDLPVCCMKVITDDAGVRLPDLNQFIDAMGQMKMIRFIWHVAFRPRYWKPLMDLGSASAKGADILASAIYTFMFNEARDMDEVNQTGAIQE